jgi:hypothetical protein
MSDKGWITNKLFLQWIKYFATQIPSNAQPTLLILDGHGSHLSLEVVEFAKGKQIFIFCFPSHSTHVLQPLDLVTFGIFKRKLKSAIFEKAARDLSFTVSKSTIGGLINSFWCSVFTRENICSAFRAAGIAPFDPLKITRKLPGHMQEEWRNRQKDLQETNAVRNGHYLKIYSIFLKNIFLYFY